MSVSWNRGRRGKGVLLSSYTYLVCVCRFKCLKLPHTRLSCLPLSDGIQHDGALPSPGWVCRLWDAWEMRAPFWFFIQSICSPCFRAVSVLWLLRRSRVHRCDFAHARNTHTCLLRTHTTRPDAHTHTLSLPPSLSFISASTLCLGTLWPGWMWFVRLRTWRRTATTRRTRV